jgi:GTPase
MPKSSSRVRAVAPLLSAATPAVDASRARPVILYARARGGPGGALAQASLTELERLVRGLGMPVARRMVGRGPGGARLVGAGKLTELAALVTDVRTETHGIAPLFVFDEALRPGQLRHLEAALGTEVADRTDIILRVFERRAGNGLGRLEVEMARLQYDAPRVRDLDAVNDRGGGGGRGERGHTGVELKKQQIRARLVALRRELATTRVQQEAERQRRSDVPAVALVGYTNAGKSSLMRALTGSQVLVEDELFATLTTTVRALEPPTAPRVLLTDTVGFIEDLPHELVASFEATLAEAGAADLLLFVVDAADDAWRAQLRVAESTVAAVGAGGVPALIVCNKIDRASPERRAEIAAALPRALQLSAHAPADVVRLRAAILAFFDDRMLDDVLHVPHTAGAMLGEIRAVARVVDQRHDEHGSWLRVRALPETLAQLRHRLGGAGALTTPHDVVARAGLHGLELESTAVDFERTGLDFLVVHADDPQGVPYILRTPRRTDVVTGALVEARVLRLVAPHLPVAVPRWQVHAPDLIIYQRLPGTPAVTMSAQGTPIWNVVDPGKPSDVFLDSFAAMLAALQSIDPALVRNAGIPRRTMARTRQHEAEVMARARDHLSPSDALWDRWQRWLADDDLWREEGALALVHGDLHPGHLLLDDSGRLIGVLDWTEAKYTDAAMDLAMFHGCFGQEALVDLLSRFARAGGRVRPRLAEQAALRWAAFPAHVADWAVRTNNAGALEFARSMLAAAG